MKHLIKGMMLAGFLIGTVAASDRLSNDEHAEGEAGDVGAVTRVDSPVGGHRRSRSASEVGLVPAAVEEGACAPYELSQLPEGSDEEGRDEGGEADSERSASGDGGKSGGTEPYAAGGDHEQGIITASERGVALGAGGLSPRSLRREVDSFAARFNDARDDAGFEAYAQEAILVDTRESLESLLGQIRASMPADERIVAMQVEVARSIAHGTCDWAFLQAKSRELLAILSPEQAAVMVNEESGSDGEGEESESGSESDDEELPTSAQMLARLALMRAGPVSVVDIANAKEAAHALVEDNWDVFKGPKFLKLRTILYAEDAETTLADGYNVQLVDAMIEVCQVIEALPTVSAVGGVDDESGEEGEIIQPPHGRRFCSPRRALIASVLIGAAGILVQVCRANGSLPF